MTPEVHGIALAFMEALDCPRALTVAILLRYEAYEEFKNLVTVPDHYPNALSFWSASQATEFLRKFDDGVPSPALEAATLEKWWAAERECFKTNRRLNEWADFGTLNGKPVDPALDSFLSSARKIVWDILGSTPPAELTPRFGPGATVSDSALYTTVLDKLSSDPTYTRSFPHEYVDWSSTAWARAAMTLGHYGGEVRGNEYFTVSKDWRSRRSCGKEPSLNVAYQLALGTNIRKRLSSRVGIDLDTGQELHKALAREGSVSGCFATIDLKSASDTVSTSLVRMMLPPLWHQVLDDLRSPFTQVDGRWIKLEKFSSMGNGFTFELETLLFFALSAATCGSGENVHVYGDDIIVPTQQANDVISVLKFFGFTPNPDKTFTGGNFRESCGGDFFLGQAVRPYQLKGEPIEPSDLIALANGIKRSVEQFGSLQHQPKLLRVWFGVLDRIPYQIRRCRGPADLGDLVIHDEQHRWCTRWRNGIRFVMVWRPSQYLRVWYDRFAYEVMYSAALYGILLSGPFSKRGWGDYVVPRDGVVSYCRGWAPYS